MKKLLSLPPNLVSYFHQIQNVSKDEYFCTNDPVGAKLGSGGGTTWLLRECHRNWAPEIDFNEWLSQEKRILIHAGGQSRRLPSYASSGKILTPIPVFRWARGQRLGQNLLDLQLPLYHRIMDIAPQSIHTMIVSGDVFIRAERLQKIPEADIVCYGLWVDPSLAKNHGVFLSSRQQPGRLDFMLQKPSVEHLAQLMQTHLFLMDVGIWLLSDRAVERLVHKTLSSNGEVSCYDLYSEFGCALGLHPSAPDSMLSDLSVAILPLEGGEFYHYGTSREMISSTMKVQNLVYDQRAIMQLNIKPHPSIFIQNSHSEISLLNTNENTWIENSWINKSWSISHDNIITGVPQNDWAVTLAPGICVDVVPIGDEQYVLRPYGISDSFRGSLTDPQVGYLCRPAIEWFHARDINPNQICGYEDIQSAQIFPVSSSADSLGHILRFMVMDPTDEQGRQLWTESRKMSADEICSYANLNRLQSQRLQFRRESWEAIARNHRRSVFYQLNLDDAASEFASLQIPEPDMLPDSEPLMKRISDQMFHSQLRRLHGKNGDQQEHEAFGLLREGLTASALQEKQEPRLDVYDDQIVWGRSPVRIDIAGGWTDTPPYCLTNGGNVVNLAIELNGQPPIQTYVKPCKEFCIILRSIDLGAMEKVTTYEDLHDFCRVGSPFSIPKAALCLAGFSPQFGSQAQATLVDQLRAFGCGIEVTLLSAIPAGSGLGTSSILAATVLGSISDFCGLKWDQAEICNRTLILEQLLTTGGGWQDQYGGVLHGVKLLQTSIGFDQTPEVRWLPDTLYNDTEYQPCHLLYYTGITRTAKQILADIVRGMFLFDTHRLELLAEMKQHALELYEAILHNDFQQMGALVRKTWLQNQLLDNGTNPPEVEAITRQIDDLCLGYKLPGAGGGGYLYMIAKDPNAAARIRHILTENRPNSCARFVEMTLSKTGLQVSRS